MRRHTSQPGFSLVEMLVVIGIIVVIVALTAPMLRVMSEGVDESAAVNSISVALDVTRTVVNKRRDSAFKQFTSTPPEWQGTNYDPGFESGTYSGAAAVFTPANEIRIVDNYQLAVSDSTTTNWPMEHYTGPNIDLSGYADVKGLDYVILPRAIGVAGMYRQDVGATNRFVLLPPPFAIRFNENGQLVASNTNSTSNDPLDDVEVVYYDGNYDGEYQTTGADWDRPNNYDPFEWDPAAPESVTNNNLLNPNTNLYQLPFERLEAVIGVVIYDKDVLHPLMRLSSSDPDYIEPWSDDSSTANDNRIEWLQANGRWLLVSRYTGNVIREQADKQ